MENHSIAELAKEKGNVAFKAKDYATARSLYSHAVAFDQSNYLYPLNRSFANLKLDRWDEAEADATQTLVLSPRNLKALLRRGIARKELRKWDKARADIQTFIDNGGDPALGAQEVRSIEDAESLSRPEPSSHTSGELDSGLANLNLQDDSSFFTIHTSTAVQDGKGAFASRDIQRGDLIMSEKPIFSIRRGVPEPLKIMSIEVATRRLSPVHLDQFLSLQNAHAECTCFPNPYLLGLFHTNAHGLRDEESSDAGVCPKASRFNHSCSPNAKFSFNSNTGELRIYALGPIPRGEEIFTAYINGNHLYGKPRRLRQAKLRDSHHFTCACSVCSLSEAESKKSDARRVKIDKVWDTIQNVRPRLQGTQVLDDIVEALHLLMQEGYLADTHSFTSYAALVCAHHSDVVSTRYWGGLSYHTRVAEFGEDSTEAAEFRKYPNPRSFPFADADLLRNLMRFDSEYNS
ncbi:hypothetical protein EI94DRAFT_1669012 [Lactarius quietus]|nr:hypothetical protein EI94DRAFT_1669012 [Lactarius quietus]